jgi:hypothetical protein
MIIISLLALFETSSWGSPNVAAGSPPATEGNRFLLVLETSKTMQRQGDAALAAIDELLSSGMHGQLRSGDTIGLWTYNEQLYTGRLPVQDWTPKSAKDIRERMLGFITQQKLEKTPDVKNILPMLARVVKDSEFVTVILVSSGEEVITGTPYDSQINEYYKTWRDRQRKSYKPFVTVFRGERGKLTQYAVCSLPWPIEIPPISAEREAAQLAQHKEPPPPAKKVAPPVGKSLIVIGSSRKGEAVEATQSAPVAIPIPQPQAQEVAKDPRLETAEAIAARLLAEAGQSPVVTPPLKIITSHGPSSNSATPVTATDTDTVPARTLKPATITKVEPAHPKSEPAKISTVASANTPSRISESPTATEEVPTAALPGSFLNRKPVQRAAMALAAGAIVCLFIAVRRPRPGYQPSIITQSLERDSR